MYQKIYRSTLLVLHQPHNFYTFEIQLTNLKNGYKTTNTSNQPKTFIS